MYANCYLVTSIYILIHVRIYIYHAFTYNNICTQWDIKHGSWYAKKDGFYQIQSVIFSRNITEIFVDEFKVE